MSIYYFIFFSSLEFVCFLLLMNVAWLRWLLGLMFCYDRGLAALEQQLPRRVRGVRNQPSVVVMFWEKEATKSDDHCIFMHFFPNSPLQGVFFVFISLGNKNALGTFDSTERWRFQRPKTTCSVSPKNQPLGSKAFVAQMGGSWLWDGLGAQEVTVGSCSCSCSTSSTSNLGLRRKTSKFRQWHGR